MGTVARKGLAFIDHICCFPLIWEILEESKLPCVWDVKSKRSAVTHTGDTLRQRNSLPAWFIPPYSLVRSWGLLTSFGLRSTPLSLHLPTNSIFLPPRLPRLCDHVLLLGSTLTRFRGDCEIGEREQIEPNDLSVRAMFPAVHKRVWSPCCAEHGAGLLWRCSWCSALGAWALGPLKCSGSSQICGMFCTKLLLGVPAVSCVPSAHFCRQIFSWLISHFLFTSQPTIFYSCVPLLHPS